MNLFLTFDEYFFQTTNKRLKISDNIKVIISLR